ncbi:MAG: hypothetical protein ACPGUC_09495 [Gammaproteobacteria bacterium]
MTTPYTAQLTKTPAADSGTGLKARDYITHPTPGNVGVCLSGGGSRAMTAGMGQLRALCHLTANGQSLLSQSLVLSTVSGGSWVGQTFSYLPASVSDQDYLNAYVADPARLVASSTPGHSQAETLDELPDDNIGTRCGEEAMSPVGLAVTALLLHHFADVPEHQLWQTLIGRNILKDYGLYSGGEDQEPTSLFSYDATTLKGQVVGTVNPSLASETAHLVTTADGSHSIRPLPVCNFAMFSRWKGAKGYLVPVQSTPFFTGIVSAPADVEDPNGRAPGGGGVTSFAFNSTLNSVNGDSVSVSQERQWSLTDAVGTSSAFFAQTLREIFDKWNKDKDAMREDLQEHMADAMSRMGGALDGKALSLIARVIAALERKRSGSLFDRLADRAGDAVLDRLLSKVDTMKVDDIVPAYNYWPVAGAAPDAGSRVCQFADGGNLENTGLGGLLAYTDVKKAISFINSSTPMTPCEKGVMGPGGQEIEGTRVLVDSQVPPLFGYQPYQKGVGYVPYPDDGKPEDWEMRHNQLFPHEAFARLLKAWDAQPNPDGEVAKPAVCKLDLETVPNPWFGVAGGRRVTVVFCYLNYVREWVDLLSDPVQQVVAGVKSFPTYSTFDTRLNATEVNLLSSLTAWCVANDQVSSLFTDLYQDEV